MLGRALALRGASRSLRTAVVQQRYYAKKATPVADQIKSNLEARNKLAKELGVEPPKQPSFFSAPSQNLRLTVERTAEWNRPLTAEERNSITAELGPEASKVSLPEGITVNDAVENVRVHMEKRMAEQLAQLSSSKEPAVEFPVPKFSAEIEKLAKEAMKDEAVAAKACEEAAEQVWEKALSSLRGVPGQYTRVLMEQSARIGATTAVRADLARLDELVTSSLEFRNNLAEADLSALNMHDVTIVFLEEIIAKKHVKHIRPVAKLYEKTMRQVMGEEHYHLTTPQVLCEYELSTIKDLLTPTDEFGLPTADVTLKHDVDPSLIDGYVLQTEDTLEDYSFKKLATELHEQVHSKLAEEGDQEMLSLVQELKKGQTASGNEKFMKQVDEGVKQLEKQLGY